MFIKHLQVHNRGKLMWLLGSTGGIVTSRKELSLLVTLQRTALHTLADLYPCNTIGMPPTHN